MRKKNDKGRCEKRVINKCREVCIICDPIQYAYADVLSANEGNRRSGAMYPWTIWST